MNTIKNLLIYSISIIALFSLTAVSCDDLGDVELPDITAPMTIERTYVIDTAAAGTIKRDEFVDPATDLAEYKDRIKDADIDYITIDISDLDGNSAYTIADFIIIDHSGLPEFVFEVAIPNFQDATETIRIDIDSKTKDFLKNTIKDDQEFGVFFRCYNEDRVHWQLDVKFHGVVTASAE